MLPGYHGVIDAFLERQGLQRNVAVESAYFGLIPYMLTQTDLVLTTGRQFMRFYEKTLPLKTLHGAGEISADALLPAVAPARAPGARAQMAARPGQQRRQGAGAAAIAQCWHHPPRDMSGRHARAYHRSLDTIGTHHDHAFRPERCEPAAFVAGPARHLRTFALDRRARAAQARPFASLAALKRALQSVVDAASVDEQLGLIRAHPELAGKAAIAGAADGRIDAASRPSPGLNLCSADEFATLHALNADYNAKLRLSLHPGRQGPDGRGPDAPGHHRHLCAAPEEPRAPTNWPNALRQITASPSCA